MKRILLLAALLALALPTAAFAGSSVDYTNSGGILSGSSSGLTLTGSTLIAVKGLNGGGLITGNDLGSVSFQTGTLTSNSNGTLTYAAGGWFKITGNGTNGIPNGALFTGTFTAPVTLTWESTGVNGTNMYELTGILSGMTGSGYQTTGVTVQLVINTGHGVFNGSTYVSSGDTAILVPEPGSLGLLGAGLIGLAGVVRRKLKA
ncbi:MAG: PEP-CTERM sorting domain-containing protein [Candidatus Sulfotelmatobacter sp.]